MIHGLQLYEFTNILSCCISTISVVQGFGDYLAFVVNDNQAGAPLKLTAWGMLASTLDSLFRAIFMAYVCTIIKGGIISECIFNLVPSSSKWEKSLLSAFHFLNVWNMQPLDQTINKNKIMLWFSKHFSLFHYFTSFFRNSFCLWLLWISSNAGRQN